MNHREITKKYSELLNKAEFATGRKEVVAVSYTHLTLPTILRV